LSESSNSVIITFYKYTRIENPEELQPVLLNFCLQEEIKGKIYLAFEGINGSVSGDHKKIEIFKSFIQSFPFIGEVIFKEDPVFGICHEKMFVRVRKELVNSGARDIDLSLGGKRLSPEGLLKLYEDGKEFVIIDTRNWYESKIGYFKNAVIPPIENFRDWPEYVDQIDDLKDKTVVTYCTGGIRCEKASAVMVEKGFKDVYQLDGGIVSYLHKFPDTFWEGGMFVFDNRRVVEVNTKEELKHVATCHYCNKPTSKYINCHNLKCDKIFVCCEDCRKTHDYSCSEECKTALSRRSRYYD
jgi:UPF0176 protein